MICSATSFSRTVFRYSSSSLISCEPFSGQHELFCHDFLPFAPKGALFQIILIIIWPFSRCVKRGFWSDHPDLFRPEQPTLQQKRPIQGIRQPSGLLFPGPFRRQGQQTAIGPAIQGDDPFFGRVSGQTQAQLAVFRAARSAAGQCRILRTILPPGLRLPPVHAR